RPRPTRRRAGMPRAARACRSARAAALRARASARRGAAPRRAPPPRVAGTARGSRGRCRRTLPGSPSRGAARPRAPPTRRDRTSPAPPRPARAARVSRDPRGCAGPARGAPPPPGRTRSPSPLTRPRHAEAGHRDDVALHLVGAAAEGEDERGAVHALDASLEHRPRRAGLQRPRLAHHLEQQLIGLYVELAAVHFDRGRLGVVERAAGHAPRLLPVEEPEHLEPGP